MVLDESVMRRADALREMMQLARSIVADGRVSSAEAEAFRAWIDRNPEVVGIAKVDRIVGLLHNVFSDGSLSEDERSDLVRALDEFGGG